MKRIVFVDEEEKHLQDLERVLQSEKTLWGMSFVTTPQRVLELASVGEKLDVMVASLGMSDMDGVDFLAKVKTLHPNSIRSGMTGSGGNCSIMKAPNFAHQLLEKPCEPHEVRVLITRACSPREHLTESPLKRRLHEVGGVPSLPVLYQEVMNEIHSSGPSIAKVAEIIEKDIGMSAKLLQVVNSAGTGLRNQVPSVVQAASLLGMQKISAMVLMVEAFSLVISKALPGGFSVESLWDHSLSVGEFAKNEMD
jgi:DNA-binding NtrC family response regulator